MKSAYIAIILAQIPAVIMLYKNKDNPPEVKKQKQKTVLLVEFVSVIVALVIAGMITGKH